MLTRWNTIQPLNEQTMATSHNMDGSHTHEVERCTHFMLYDTDAREINGLISQTRVWNEVDVLGVLLK